MQFSIKVMYIVLYQVKCSVNFEIPALILMNECEFMGNVHAVYVTYIRWITVNSFTP